MSADGATPIAREGAREREVKYRMQALAFLAEAGLAGMVTLDGITALAVAIEARDASAVEVERTMREALEPFAWFRNKDGTVWLGRDGDRFCGSCALLASLCDEHTPDCKGHFSRTALARVASLRGGTGR